MPTGLSSAMVSLEQRTSGVKGVGRIIWHNLTPTKGLDSVAASIARRCASVEAKVFVSPTHLYYQGKTREIPIKGSEFVAARLFKAGVKEVTFLPTTTVLLATRNLNALMDSRVGTLRRSSGIRFEEKATAGQATEAGVVVGLVPMPTPEIARVLDQAKAPATSAGALQAIATDPSLEGDSYFRKKVWYFIARHPNCNEATHAYLFEMDRHEANQFVWQAQASNPNLPEAIVDKFLQLHIALVAGELRVIAASTKSPAILHKLARVDALLPGLLIAIGESPYTQAEDVAHVLLQLQRAAEEFRRVSGVSCCRSYQYAEDDANILEAHRDQWPQIASFFQQGEQALVLLAGVRRRA